MKIYYLIIAGYSVILLLLLFFLLKKNKNKSQTDDSYLNLVLNQNNETRKELFQILENQRKGLSDQNKVLIKD